MKKRIVSLVLIMGIVLMGCSNSSSDKKETTSEKKTDAVEVYLAASKKMQKEPSFAAEMTMKMDMKSGSEKAATELSTDFKINNANDPEKMEMKMNMNMEVEGQKVPVTIYMVDGYMYMDMLGSKLKQANPEGSTDALGSGMGAGISEFSKNQIDKATLKEDGDKQVVSITLNTKAMNKFAKLILGAESSSSLKDAEIDIKSFDIEVVIDKDGYISEQNMNFEMSVKQGSQKADATAEVTYKYTEIGKQTMDFPDFSEYKLAE